MTETINRAQRKEGRVFGAAGGGHVACATEMRYQIARARRTTVSGRLLVNPIDTTKHDAQSVVPN